MNEFKVNDFITLRLEDGDTNIYVKNKLFRQCKFLFIDIPVNKAQLYDEIESIDEVSEKYDRAMEPSENYVRKIPSKVEFWGHCSNLQVWAEENYNTDIIHSNLAFPLLERLVEEGDLIARRVFKEEIVKKIKSGYIPTIIFLEEEDYINYLSNEEISSLLLDSEIRLFEKILESYRNGIHIQKLVNNLFKIMAKNLYNIMKKSVTRILKKKDLNDLYCLIQLNWIRFLPCSRLKALFGELYRNVDIYSVLMYNNNHKYDNKEKYGGVYLLLKIFSFMENNLIVYIFKSTPKNIIMEFTKGIRQILNKRYYYSKYESEHKEFKIISKKIQEMIKLEFNTF